MAKQTNGGLRMANEKKESAWMRFLKAATSSEVNSDGDSALKKMALSAGVDIATKITDPIVDKVELKADACLDKAREKWLESWQTQILPSAKEEANNLLRENLDLFEERWTRMLAKEFRHELALLGCVLLTTVAVVGISLVYEWMLI